MIQYKGKVLCECCQKPIGEAWQTQKLADYHKPYINYRLWKGREVCNFCRIELVEKERRDKYKGYSY